MNMPQGKAFHSPPAWPNIIVPPFIVLGMNQFAVVVIDGKLFLGTENVVIKLINPTALFGKTIWASL
jgi:hypothetical protein